MFFFGLTSFGQQLDSPIISKEKRLKDFNTETYQKKQSLIKNTPLEYSYCNTNGFIDLDIKLIKQDIISTYVLEDDNQAIIVSTSTGKLLKINNFSNHNSTVEVICDFPSNGLFSGLTDVAVDKNLNYFATNFNRLFSINKETCETTDLPFSILLDRALNSLSFDKQENLYFGYGGSTAV